jgi:periplasmic protein TonB
MLQYYIAVPDSPAAVPSAVNINLVAEPMLAAPALARGTPWTGVAASFAVHAALLVVAMFAVQDLGPGSDGTELEAISVSIVSAGALDAIVNPPVEPSPAPPAAIMPNAGTMAEADRDERVAAPAEKPPEAKPELPLLAPDPDTFIATPRPSLEPVSKPESPLPQLPDASADTQRTGGAAVSGSAAGTSTAGRAAASPGEVDRYARDVVTAIGRNRPKGVSLKGKVVIEFALRETGDIGSAKVATSSGKAKLDTIALNAIERTRYPAPPTGMTALQLTYRVPFTFD